MRNINPIFEDDEFDEIKLIKDQSPCRNWHDFIIEAARLYALDMRCDEVRVCQDPKRGVYINE